MQTDFLKNGLTELGISIPENFEFDGKFYRFGKKKAYSLVGNEFISYNRKHILKTATFFDWTGKISTKTFKSWKDSTLFPKDRTKIEEIKSEIKENSKKDHSDFFNEQENAKEDHPYLLKKSIDLNFHGFQQDYPVKQIDKTLLIPMINLKTKELNGIEKITENSKKFREKGSVGKFSVFPFTNKVSEEVFLTEGFADGFSLWECSGKETYSVFGLGNFDHIVEELANSQLNKKFFIMADEPTNKQLKALSRQKGESITPEAYRESIHKKFAKYLNVFVLFCGDQGSINPDGTANLKDFNDFYLANFEKARGWLHKQIEKTPNLILLGNLENKIYIYTSKPPKKVIEIKEISKNPTLRLLANEDFWKRKFPGKTTQSIITSLFEASERTYDPTKIRRGGAYLDDNNLVINDGEGNLIGKTSENYTYLPIGEFDYNPTPVLKKETKDFLNQIQEDYFSKQAYEDKYDGYFILAWAFLSILAPALRIRFSVGLHGESGVGKTETYNNLIKPLLSNYENKHKGVTPTCTFASFKNNLKNGYCSFCLSEAEGKNYIYKFWTFLRASTDETDGSGSEQMGRGGIIEKIPNDLMILSTYNRPPEIEEADYNRIIEIDFHRIKRDSNKFSESSLWLDNFRLKEIGKNIIDYTLFNFEELRNRIAEYYRSNYATECVGHKKRAGYLIAAFYENLKVLSEDKIKSIKERFIEHTLNKTRQLDKAGNLRAIANLSIWREKEKLTLIELLRKMPESDEDIASENWNSHYKIFWQGFKDLFNIKILKTKGHLSIAIPKSDCLDRELSQLGLNSVKNNIFTLAQREWGLNDSFLIRGKSFHCMVVPMNFFLKEKHFDNKKVFFLKNKKYFNDFT